MEDPTPENMETEENLLRGSIPKSSSFSPKVTRPKLPPFAGSGGRSISPRSKTDPGRGEIKAIMEDIMNLKKTDWKTFSRSRTMPRSKGKSMSTDTSPNRSPRVGSPGPDEPNTKSAFSRDRSRSLKLLTDKLKRSPSSKFPSAAKTANVSDDVKEIKVTDEEGASQLLDVASSGNSCEQWYPQNIQSHSLSSLPGGSPRRSPDRRSMERMYEQIPETPEDLELEEAEDNKSHLLSASSEESFRSVPDTIHEGSQLCRERTPDSDIAVGIREKSPESDIGAELMTRSQEDFGKRAISDKSAEDEGVIGDIEEHIQPVVSTYIYHPIPRNSKFLQLAATKPPKRFPPERRSGITMVSSRGRVSSFKEMKGEDSKSSEARLMPGDHPRQRLQRRSDCGKSGKSGAQKSSPRFITHPPHAKSSHSEAGSVDSNGFAALKSSTTDSEEDMKQNSQLSLADSQFASEGSEYPSYMDVMESVVSEGAEMSSSSSSSSERKNGKSGKQKSKSDPSGDKTRDVLDFPHALESPQSHSAPLLSKDKLHAGVADKGLIMSEDGVKQKSRSDNYLSTCVTMDEEVDIHSSDDEGSVNVNFRMEPHYTRHERTLSPPPTTSSTKILTLSPSGTPHGPSPSPTPAERPTNLLSVPSSSSGSSGRKPNIFRSASSASVLQSRKNAGTPNKEKDVVRKYSITSDEAMVNSKSSLSLGPEFLPLGDTSSAATSMPAVWNKDRLSSTDSPEREPGFIKVRASFLSSILY